ncbi:MAG: catecholate siderophore receptor [Flavobacteriales bacterium]
MNTQRTRTLSPKLTTQSALAVAIAASLSSTIHAEEITQLPTVKVESEAEDSYKPERSTSHKNTQPLLDTAKTITVITKAVMQDRGVENLRDALRNVPGITLAAGEGGTPTGDSLSIRGFSARTDILIDGIRDIAGYTRDTYNLEAVEIAKGPGSAVSGRGATGGSINLQTKTAKLDDINEISASLGTANDYRVSVDANRALSDTVALRINLLTDDGEVAGRDEVKNSKNAAAVSLAAGLGTTSRFSLSGEYQKQDNLPDYGLPWVSAGQSSYAPELEEDAGGAPSVNYSNFYGNIFRDFEDVTAKSLTAKYEHDLSENTMLRVQARVGDVTRLSIVSAPRFINITNSTNVRLSDEKTRDTKNSLSIVQLDVIGQYQTGNVSHDVVLGMEIGQEKEKRWNYDDAGTDNLDTNPELVDLYTPNSRVAYSGNYERDGTSTESTGDTNALYIFDTLSFNPQWEFSVGARWESFNTIYHYDYNDPTATLEADESLLSWNTSLVFKPATNGSIYLGLGNSFNPSAEDLTASTRGNDSNLEPEETLSYEFGTKWDVLNGKILASAAIFRTDKTNSRTDAPDGAFAEDDGRFNTLNGEQRVDGLELSAYGQVNNKLSLTAAYTYQKSEVLNAEEDDITQEGNELPRTPKHAASVWATYEISNKWVAGAGAQYTSERYNNSNEVTREIADSYLTFDMMLAYNLTQQLRLQLNGTNLSDEKYEDQLGGGHFIPGESRHFRLSASYTF